MRIPDTTIKLSSIIFLYKKSDTKDTYAEVASLQVHDGQIETIKLRPITKGILKKLRSISNISTDKEVFYYEDVFPKELMYVSPVVKGIVWRVPSIIKKINSNLLEFPSGEKKFPDMIFAYNQDNLYAWATDENDNLLSLGLPNYDTENGYVCLSVEINTCNGLDVTKRLEESFFAWVFVSWAHNKESKKQHAKVIKEYENLEGPFNTKILKKCQSTIKEVIQFII